MYPRVVNTAHICRFDHVTSAFPSSRAKLNRFVGGVTFRHLRRSLGIVPVRGAETVRRTPTREDVSAVRLLPTCVLGFFIYY